MKIEYEKYPLPNKIRHHVGSNLYFPLKDLSFHPFYYPPILDEIDTKLVFSNKMAPKVLDIGCGKGKFLFDYASEHPKSNVLGLEVRKTLVDWIQNVIKSENAKNVWAFWYSAANGLKFLESNSIEKAFYLFPDPWPKKRQQNRRLFSVEFLKELHRVLKPDGALYLATDCDYVDEHHRKVLIESGIFNFEDAKPKDWNFPVTNKENFCIINEIPTFKLMCTPKK